MAIALVEASHRLPDSSPWIDPFTLVLVGGVMVLVGVVLARVARAARVRRARGRR